VWFVQLRDRDAGKKSATSRDERSFAESTSSENEFASMDNPCPRLTA
jgi:hypothetical protein